jgi:hypothetical protein
LDEGGAKANEAKEGLVVGCESGAESGGWEVRLQFVADDGEQDEAGAAACTMLVAGL